MLNSNHYPSKTVKRWIVSLNKQIRAKEAMLDLCGENLSTVEIQEANELREEIEALQAQLDMLEGNDYQREYDYQMYCWNMDRRA